MIKLSIIAIAIASLGYLAFTSNDEMLTTRATENKTFQSENSNLLKKWKLSHYEVLRTDYKPDEKEKGDYIHFKADNTYTSVSEGKFDKGIYKLTESNITLSNSTEEGELKLKIKKLTANKLVVIIEDSSDADAKYVSIHFIKQ